MFTRRLLPYLKILRPDNAAMSAIGVLLGFWIGRVETGSTGLILLCLASLTATGFGNVINDIFDVSTDRVSHPDRPLPSGAMSITGAWVFAAILAAGSVASGFAVSSAHGIGAAVPVLLLAAYARWLKRTPLAGNALISLLVAYPLLYGSLGAPGAYRLWIPAILAFMANFCREIVKDLQDREGDASAGMITSALLPRAVLNSIIVLLTIVFVVLMYAPYALGFFGVVYLGVCLVAVVPIRAIWLRRLLSPDAENRLPSISLMIKIEMLAGLLALAADQSLAPR